MLRKISTLDHHAGYFFLGWVTSWKMHSIFKTCSRIGASVIHFLFIMKSRNARKDRPQYFPYCGWSLFFLPLLRTINGGCERKGLSTPWTRSSPAQAPETVVLASACDLIALLDELDLESTGLGTRGCESGTLEQALRVFRFHCLGGEGRRAPHEPSRRVLSFVDFAGNVLAWV